MASELTHQFEVLAKFILEKLETDVVSINKDQGAAATTTTTATTAATAPAPADPWGVVKTSKEVAKSRTPQSQPIQSKGSNSNASKGASHNASNAQSLQNSRSKEIGCKKRGSDQRSTEEVSRNIQSYSKCCQIYYKRYSVGSYQRQRRERSDFRKRKLWVNSPLRNKLLINSVIL